MKKIGLYICILLAGLFYSCSDDNWGSEGGYGKPVTLSASITTRATGVPEAHESNEEIINDWWVVFVNSEGNIALILDRETATGRTNPVVQEEFEFMLQSGTYTAYSFANISQDKVEAVAGTLQEGEQMPDLANVNINVASIIENGRNVKDNQKLLPMSGKQEIIVPIQGKVNIDLEVVRMIAKMEFKYYNESSRAVTINSLKMQQADSDLIPLLPNYTYLDNGLEWKALSGTARYYSRSYNETLPTYRNNPADTLTDKFYMLESIANDTPMRRYLLTLNITRAGKSAETIYALTTELSTIYRNDHIIIPIIITDYTVDVDVLFYPPIGGYPAVRRDKVADDFYFEFATQGTFKIRPKVVNTADVNDVMVYEDTNRDPYFTYEIKNISDPNNIFEETPSVEVGSGEMLGRLNTNQGEAYIDMEVIVHRNAATDQLYTRRIYITRKN